MNKHNPAPPAWRNAQTRAEFEYLVDRANTHDDMQAVEGRIMHYFAWEGKMVEAAREEREARLERIIRYWLVAAGDFIVMSDTPDEARCEMHRLATVVMDDFLNGLDYPLP